MDIIETIKEQIANNTILLYMKGSPNAPQCGFSSRAAQAVMRSLGSIQLLASKAHACVSSARFTWRSIMPLPICRTASY